MPELIVGKSVPLSTRVRRVLAPNAGVFTGPGTNSYLVGTDELALIDPGPLDSDHGEALLAALDAPLRWILVTHTHIDHSPGAAFVKERTGAELFGFDARDGFVPTTAIGDGWRLRGPGFTLRAVATPGHASNHLCYLLEEERSLFAGDHIMNGSTVVIRPPDGDMSRYMTSLARLENELELERIYPAHGDVIEDPSAKIREYVDHRLAREAALLAALRAAGSAHIDDLVQTVYTDVSPTLHPIARFSVWAHLRKLASEGLVAMDEDDVESLFSAT